MTLLSAGTMPMSQQNNSLTHSSVRHSGPMEVPCYATCLNLQLMHPQVKQRLGLVYRQWFMVARYEIDPTPEHLGAWLQLAHRDGYPVEWIPAHFFNINQFIWPN